MSIRAVFINLSNLDRWYRGVGPGLLVDSNAGFALFQKLISIFIIAGFAG